MEHLPSKLNYPHGEILEKIYDKMGISYMPDGNDRYKVNLPYGWKIVSTDHVMWYNLIDDWERVRAQIFSKQSYWDKEYFINIERRINPKIDRIGFFNGDYSTDANHDYISNNTPMQGRVLDYDGTVLFHTQEMKCDVEYFLYKGTQKAYTDGYKEKSSIIHKELELQCLKYLSENYPDYEDVTAYWELKKF